MSLRRLHLFLAAQAHDDLRIDIGRHDDEAIAPLLEAARHRRKLARRGQRPAFGILDPRGEAVVESVEIEPVVAGFGDIEREGRARAVGERCARAAVRRNHAAVDQRRGPRDEAEMSFRVLRRNRDAIGSAAQPCLDQRIVAGTVVVRLVDLRQEPRADAGGGLEAAEGLDPVETAVRDIERKTLPVVLAEIEEDRLACGKARLVAFVRKRRDRLVGARGRPGDDELPLRVRRGDRDRRVPHILLDDVGAFREGDGMAARIRHGDRSAGRGADRHGQRLVGGHRRGRKDRRGFRRKRFCGDSRLRRRVSRGGSRPPSGFGAASARGFGGGAGAGVGEGAGATAGAGAACFAACMRTSAPAARSAGRARRRGAVTRPGAEFRSN